MAPRPTHMSLDRLFTEAIFFPHTSFYTKHTFFMAQRLLVYMSPVILLFVCFFIYTHVSTSENTETIRYSDTTSPLTQETKEDTPDNQAILDSDKTPETKIISTSEQLPQSMHTEQFTLTHNETVHTSDNLITLTLTGFTIERNEPDPSLPYSADPGVICPSFILRVRGIHETLSLCIATQGDIPNKNTGSIKNADGTVTLSVLDMSGSTSSSGHPEKIVVQITY